MCYVKCNKAGHKVMYTVRMQQCKQRGGGGRERGRGRKHTKILTVLGFERWG